MVARTGIIDHYAGSKLRVARIVKELSQEELAGKVGITFQQVQKYEKGLNRISAGKLYWFSRILGVSLDFFFKGIDGVLTQDPNFARNVAVSAEDVESDNDNSQNDSSSGDSILMGIDFESKETLTLLRSYYSIKDSEDRNKILSIMKMINHSNEENHNELETETENA